MLLTPCPHCGKPMAEKESGLVERNKLENGETCGTVRCNQCTPENSPKQLNG